MEQKCLWSVVGCGPQKPCYQCVVVEKLRLELQVEQLQKNESDLLTKNFDLQTEVTKEANRATAAERLNGELKKQLRTAQGVINKHVADQIEGLHCVDCVAEEDQDCDCPMVVPIMEAMEGYENPCICADFTPGESSCSKCGGYAEKRVDPFPNVEVCVTCKAKLADTFDAMKQAWCEKCEERYCASCYPLHYCLGR